MDNVTHSLVGLMIARVTQKQPGWKYPAMIVVASNLPDIDVVSFFGGVLTYLDWHRGYTHTFLLAPLLALILIVLFGMRSWRAWMISLATILSHLLLDWTNVYGIRFLLPFSSHWMRLDITDVVDPFILLILLLAVAAPALAGLVSSEIGAKKTSGAKRGWAWFALMVLLAYEGGRFAAHQRAVNVMSARLYNGAVASRVTAIPSRWSIFQWRGIAEGSGYVSIVPIDLATDFDPSEGRIDYNAPPNPTLEIARRTRPFEVFGRFNQLPFWKVIRLVDDSTEVQLIDLRFGTPERPGFTATAVVDASGVVRESKFRFGAPPIN